MDKETLKQKESRIYKDMALKEIQNDLKKAKDFLENPKRVGSIDLDKVHDLNKKIK